jgi:CHASE3 domain sensor protein
MEIINPIYEDLNNDENIIPIFVNILESKTTEEAVFKKFKEDYDNKIEKLKAITEEVKKQKNEVSNASLKYGQKISGKNGYGISDEARQYFNNLEQTVNRFMHVFEKIQKAENYYNGLYQKIDDIIKASNKWMISRNEEKKSLIDAINKGQIKPNKSGTSSYF